jgi:tetratricopeptide (TPR) repeat protein
VAAAAWNTLGNAHHQLGQHDESISCFSRAVGRWDERADRYKEGRTPLQLGDAHLAAGRPDAARTAGEQARTILDDLRHQDAEKVHARLRSLGTGRGRHTQK